MKINPWAGHQYVAVENEDGSATLESAPNRKWTQYQVPLPRVLAILAVQSILWALPLLYLLHLRNGDIILPIDRRLRDSLGNSCSFHLLRGAQSRQPNS